MRTLEKTARRLYKLLRSEKGDAAHFVQSFTSLMEQLFSIEATYLDSSYHRELRHYLEKLHKRTIKNSDWVEGVDYEMFCKEEASALNRLQKIKSKASAKKRYDNA